MKSETNEKGTKSLGSQSTEIFFNGKKQEFIWARHTESQRATFTNFIITIALLLEGFIVQRGFDDLSTPLAVSMIILGLLGMVVTSKLYERFNLHIQRVAEFEKRLDEPNPDVQFTEAVRRAKEIYS